jgi:hypothetical protein
MDSVGELCDLTCQLKTGFRPSVLELMGLECRHFRPSPSAVAAGIRQFMCGMKWLRFFEGKIINLQLVMCEVCQVALSRHCLGA